MDDNERSHGFRKDIGLTINSTPESLEAAATPISADLVEALAKRHEANGPAGWRDTWRACGQLGLFSAVLGADQGGKNASATAFCETLMELGRNIPDNGLTMGIASHVWTIIQPLARFGTGDQQAAYLPALVSGEMVGAFALTEHGSGSDALSLTVTALRDGDEYVLNGAKSLIGMAPICDVAIVFASTAPEHGSWGISAFLVEAGDTGLVRKEAEQKLGLTTLPLGQMELKDCRIPVSRRLGPEGAGARIIQTVLDWERCFILAPHVGAMERQLAECAAFANAREVSGQPIGEFQSVSNRLADMRVRLETSQLMLRNAARLFDIGELLTQVAAMTNLHVSEAFLSSSLDAVRIFGGAGYLAGSPVSMDLRDAMGGVIYSGTSDVQRNIIAKVERQHRRTAAQTGPGPV